MAASGTQLSSHISFSSHAGSIVATLGLASHSPLICHDQNDGLIRFFLYGNIDCEDMQKIAQAMPRLTKVPRPHTANEEDSIRYYKIDTGRKHYVCNPDNSNEIFFSHILINKSMVITAGAKVLMEKTQEIMLHENDKANGRDKLVFEEKLKNSCLEGNIKNCRRVITFDSMIARCQHKIALAKHITFACTNNSDVEAKISNLSTLFADASQRIFCQHFKGHYFKLYEKQFLIDCILGFGHYDNIFNTTSQIYYSTPQGGNLKETFLHLAIYMMIIQMIQPITHAYSSLATSSSMSFQEDLIFHFNESTVFQHRLQCLFLKACIQMWAILR